MAERLCHALLSARLRTSFLKRHLLDSLGLLFRKKSTGTLGRVSETTMYHGYFAAFVGGKL